MSTVVLDTITGKSTATTITIGSTPVVSASANSMTIRGEGSAQTSIQQGLAKAWVFGTDAGVTTDTFNISTATDNGTGDYTYPIINDMANATYAITATASQETSAQPVICANPNSDNSLAAGTFRVELGFGNIGASALQQIDKKHYVVIHGDLA